MITKETIKGIVDEHLKGSEIFPVGIKVSSSNSITVTVDRKTGGISIDECVEIHRHIESMLDRETEDYELQVSSPGLTTPFVVIEQYYKNEGKKVEVTDDDGVKYAGILHNVNAGGFELETEVKIKGKGKEMKELSFNFDNVKSTRLILTIK